MKDHVIIMTLPALALALVMVPKLPWLPTLAVCFVAFCVFGLVYGEE